MSKHCWTLKYRYESQFSAAFYPIMLSDTKRAEIIHRAEEIRAVRNDISEVFFSDMLGFQDMSKFEAFNFFNPAFNTRLSSHYLKKAIEDARFVLPNACEKISAIFSNLIVPPEVPLFPKN